MYNYGFSWRVVFNNINYEALYSPKNNLKYILLNIFFFIILYTLYIKVRYTYKKCNINIYFIIYFFFVCFVLLS